MGTVRKSHEQLLAENKELQKMFAVHQERFTTPDTPIGIGEGAVEPFKAPTWVDNLKRRRGRKARKKDRYKTRIPDKVLRSVFDSVPAGICVATDRSCRDILSNLTACSFFRVKQEDNLSFSSTTPPAFKMLYQGKELEPAEMPLRLAAWNGERIADWEIEFVWEDGTRKYAIANSNPIYSDDGVIIGAIATFEDITKRRRIESELRESRNRYQALIETNVDFIWEMDDRGRYTYCSPQMEKLWGIKPEEMIGKTPFDMMPPDLRERFTKKFLEHVNSPGGIRELETTSYDGQGRVISLETSGVPFFDDSGVLLGYRGITRDITERRRMEEALRESEEQHRLLAEKLRRVDLRQSEERFYHSFYYSPVMMSLVRIDDGCFLDVNFSWLDTLGYTRDEVIGRNACELEVWVDKEQRARLINEVRAVGRLENVEVKRRTKDGRVLTCLMSTVTVKYGGADCSLVSLTDITQRKQMEKEIARLDRLNLVGEMAVSIGHEIRNPMTTIRGFLQMLNEREGPENNQEYYSLMIEELDRANAIITDFLSMAKDKAVNMRPGYLNSIIRAIHPMLQADASLRDMEVRLNLGSPPKLMLDEKEIRRLVLNLVRNGMEAMEPGGVLTIRTKTVKGEAVLEVEDQGKGIPTEMLEKIGTPFQTTKENGTGLGLAVCYSIANRHGAGIEVDTGPGGTTFRVRFRASH